MLTFAIQEIGLSWGLVFKIWGVGWEVEALVSCEPLSELLVSP